MDDRHAFAPEKPRDMEGLTDRLRTVHAVDREARDRYAQLRVLLGQRALAAKRDHRDPEPLGIQPLRRAQRVQLGTTDAHGVDGKDDVNELAAVWTAEIAGRRGRSR